MPRRCREVESEYNVKINATVLEVEAVQKELDAKNASLESLKHEKVMSVRELLGPVDRDEYTTRHGVDRLYTLRCFNHLTEWRGKSRGEVVYDSAVDLFKGDSLFIKIKDKPNVGRWVHDGRRCLAGSPAVL